MKVLFGTFGRGSVELLVSVLPWSRRAPICTSILGDDAQEPTKPERAQWKQDDLLEFDKDESRRQLWLDATAARKVAPIRAVRGRVCDTSQNLDVLTSAERSQHASVSLASASVSSQRLAHRRVGDLFSSWTGPSQDGGREPWRHGRC